MNSRYKNQTYTSVSNFKKGIFVFLGIAPFFVFLVVSLFSGNIISRPTIPLPNATQIWLGYMLLLGVIYFLYRLLNNSNKIKLFVDNELLSIGNNKITFDSLSKVTHNNGVLKLYNFKNTKPRIILLENDEAEYITSAIDVYFQLKQQK